MLSNTTVSIDKSKIKISPREAAQRLAIPLDFENEFIDACENELIKTANPRYYCANFDVKIGGENTVDFGFAKFYSSDLCKNLKECVSAFVLAVTLGMETDRLVNMARVASPSKAFVIDALASAMAEAAADFVTDEIKSEFNVRPRFSPGYGDFCLEAQSDILSVLNADKFLGIKLGDNLLMTPKKSITAVQGVL